MAKGNIFDLNDGIKSLNESLHCVCCKGILKTSSFYVSNSKNAMTRMDKSGTPRMIICKSCCQKIFDHFYSIYKSVDKAIYNFCISFDVYYNSTFANDIAMADIPSMISVYFRRYSLDGKSNRTFADSDIFVKKKKKAESSDVDENDDSLTEEDLKNRREILATFHYDPFEKELPEDKKKLYRNLVTMIDQTMSEDLVRQRAAIEIVRTFARIDKWTEAINEMSADPQTMLQNSKDIKTLIDAKTKETDMVTKFSKDHGFAERYAMAKSKGAGTLGAAMRDMEEFHFDDGKVNLFDIKTSKSILQAAQISTEAMMKQLSLSEADYVDMLKKQREEVTRLNQENDRLKETNRLIYKQITKQELLKELLTDLRQKGLGEEEVASLVAAEIHYDDNVIKTQQEKTND